MTSLIHGKNDSFIFRKNLLTIAGILIAVSAALFLPELLGIHPQKPQRFSETLRVNQHRIARSVQTTGNSIEDLMGTTASRATEDKRANSLQTNTEKAADENLKTISPEVAEVGLRARQAITSITESSQVELVFDSKPAAPKFAVHSWEDVQKSEIQERLKRVSIDTTQLLSLLSTEDFPRSNFELRSFQSALHPLLTPKKREKGASLTRVLEFLDYRDSMVTTALLQERAPRQTKLAWKAISLKHVLNDSLSQQRKAEINATFRPDFYLTEARFRYDWTAIDEEKFLTPLRGLLSGTFNHQEIQSIQWYYSDAPHQKRNAHITGKERRHFQIKWGSDVRHSTLIVVAKAKDGAEYAKAYSFRRNRDNFALRKHDRFWELQYPTGMPDKRIEKLFLVAEGVKGDATIERQQLAWHSEQTPSEANYATF